jgi:hypothetical protein
VQGQAGPARVIAAGGVDEKDIGTAVECSYRGGEHGALAEREEPGSVRGAGDAGHDGLSHQPTGDGHDRPHPGPIARPSRPRLPRQVDDEAPTHGRLGPPGPPRGRGQPSEPLLLGHQRGGVFGPPVAPGRRLSSPATAAYSL